MEFDLSANKANVDESIDPNSKSCAFDIFYYWLVCATFVSLVDGFATLFLGKRKSLSSILLFSTNQGQNRQKSYRGPLNYIFNKSDLTSGLSEKNSYFFFVMRFNTFLKQILQAWSFQELERM